MNTLTATAAAAGTEIELATFRVADMLTAIDIDRVREINRHLDMTPVPGSPDCVRGVVNLRGDVVTILDLRAMLQLPRADITTQSRNVVVQSNDEYIGLLVDCVTDVVAIHGDSIVPAPANVRGMDGRFFRGVCELDNNLMVIIDIEELLISSM